MDTQLSTSKDNSDVVDDPTAQPVQIRQARAVEFNATMELIKFLPSLAGLTNEDERLILKRRVILEMSLHPMSIELNRYHVGVERIGLPISWEKIGGAVFGGGSGGVDRGALGASAPDAILETEVGGSSISSSFSSSKTNRKSRIKKAVRYQKAVLRELHQHQLSEICLSGNSQPEDTVYSKYGFSRKFEFWKRVDSLIGNFMRLDLVDNGGKNQAQGRYGCRKMSGGRKENGRIGVWWLLFNVGMVVGGADQNLYHCWGNPLKYPGFTSSTESSKQNSKYGNGYYCDAATEHYGGIYCPEKCVAKVDESECQPETSEDKKLAWVVDACKECCSGPKTALDMVKRLRKKVGTDEAPNKALHAGKDYWNALQFDNGSICNEGQDGMKEKMKESMEYNDVLISWNSEKKKGNRSRKHLY